MPEVWGRVFIRRPAVCRTTGVVVCGPRRLQIDAAQKASTADRALPTDGDRRKRDAAAVLARGDTNRVEAIRQECYGLAGQKA